MDDAKLNPNMLTNGLDSASLVPENKSLPRPVPHKSSSFGGQGHASSSITASAPTKLQRFPSDPVTAEEREHVLEAGHEGRAASATSSFSRSNSVGDVESPSGFSHILNRSISQTRSISTRLFSFNANNGGEQGNFSTLGPRDVETGDGAAGSEKTFFCNICLENCSKSLSFIPAGCPLHHEHCRPCMSGYTESMVQDGVVQHTCPGQEHCGGVLSMDELKSLLSSQAFDRLQRLTHIKGNPNYRECPVCGVGVEPMMKEAVSSEPVTPEIVCTGCGLKYCFFHANAHPNRSCGEYSRTLSVKTKGDLSLSEEWVNKETKKCPQCSAPTEKNGGCNHMTCQSCKANWCWLCERSMADVTAHYALDSTDGCPGSQFGDQRLTPELVERRRTRFYNPHSYGDCVNIFWGVVFRSVYIPLYSVLFAVLSIVCVLLAFAFILPYFICNLSCPDVKDRVKVGLKVSILITAVIAMLVDLVLLAVYLILYALSFGCCMCPGQLDNNYLEMVAGVMVPMFFVQYLHLED